MTTPTCPGCKAKFSHNPATQSCNNCGLPDEIALLGPRLISRWRRKQGLKRQAKTFFGGSAGRKKMKHGRQTR